MRKIEISSLDGAQILEKLNLFICGQLDSEWGEHVLTFDNEWGNGTIRCVAFDWGVSLMDFDVHFNEDVKIIFQLKRVSPVEFIFISEGNMQLGIDQEEHLKLNTYQNVIISPKKSSTKKYILPKKIRTKVNFIQVLKKEYAKKKHNNLSYLHEILLSVFNDRDSEKAFNHIGNYNLKIADEVKQLSSTHKHGIAHKLSLEGRLYLILAMQLMEHYNFETEVSLPDSLSKQDIRKIHNLSEFIIDNISEPLTINSLTTASGLSPKKLQLGFKVLYSKSVNEYIRQNKLEIARDQLRNTDLSISEIVYKIGFRSRSYFSKIFSERYGILPTEYRKKLRKVY